MTQSIVFDYADSLAALDRAVPLSEKLACLHRITREHLPLVHRIAVAIYDSQTDLLKTFVHSSDGIAGLTHYQARLSESESLRTLAASGSPRVVNDLSLFANERLHTRRIREAGYGSSYTLPLYARGRFAGVVFFNSREQNAFRPEHLHYLDLVARLLNHTVLDALQYAETLSAAVKTATELAQQRDHETGAHLERMARYTRLIALELAEQQNFDDEFIENLSLFARLHDVGKIAIPDRILLKPGRLTAEEFQVMKTHSIKGREIIEAMMENFDLKRMPHYGDMLRNIAECHHEAINGRGYPHGLSGSEIPIESRIVAAADVFDALTSERPYKAAWDNDRAFLELQKLAGVSLDSDCVQALIKNRARVEEIQALFQQEQAMNLPVRYGKA